MTRRRNDHKDEADFMNRKLAAILTAVGLAIFGITVYVVIGAVKHPTPMATIMVTLLCAIGVQLAFILLQSSYGLWRGPEARDLKVEAQARKRAADALEDAETAEKIKLELDAYIAVRARRLEIERRRVELANTLDVVTKLHDELNESEKLLELEVTQLDPKTIQILDDITEDRRPAFPEFYLYGIPVGQVMQFAYEQLSSRIEKNTIRRLSSLAPEALSEEDASSVSPEARST